MNNLSLNDFDYNLPESLIAQYPCEKRENSKLMELDKNAQTISHRHFFDIVDLLNENDLLVLNNTKVIPARIYAKKRQTDAKIEIFLLKPIDKAQNSYECLIKPSKRVVSNTFLDIAKNVSAQIINKLDEDGKWAVKFNCEDEFSEVLAKVGIVPLPPYIERKMTSEELKKLDFERYQTVYAEKAGSVAAPTAGLHFTKEILDKLKAKGVEIAYVTLNVGLGTFKPVKCENVLEHKMDSETFEISEKTASTINNALQNEKRIVAVGTTTVRTLETTMAKHGKILPIKDESRLFIYPGYKFQIVDKLITNFHLPKSTLIMLVSAFAGKEFIFNAYEEAIANAYRFYSYGDCMFIH